MMTDPDQVSPIPPQGDPLQELKPAAEPKASHPADEIFETVQTFADLGLRASLLKGLEKLGFERPTRIQATLIPQALRGHDILGQAKTGTGKTAAFGLPMLHLCNRDTPFQGLVLAPTRELAIQITSEINELGQFTPIRAVTVYGGQRIGQQVEKLSKGPQIIVGTPGRVLDMLERGHLHFNNIRFTILDEVDRMLDIGFREDIRRVLRQCPPPGIQADNSPGRQTIFVSATISQDIEKLARQFMKDPQKLVVAAGSLTVSLVQQFYLTVQPWDKKNLLRHLLTHEEPALTVVFCRLKRTVDDLARYLSKHGIDAHPIHGDLSQSKRNATMTKLRSGQLSVLIASDLASRGIDVEGITHVVNYDLPEDIELYVHRIGRTARAGRGGVAWSLVTPEQGGLLTEIEKLINAEIPRLDYPDFVPGPPPEDRRSDGGGRDRRPRSRFGPSGPGQGRGGSGDRRGSGRGQSEPVPPQPEVHQPTPDASQAPERQAITPPQPAGPVDVPPDPTKFPGGVVPTKLPPKRLHGRLPTARGKR